jgi:hypothetical protein
MIEVNKNRNLPLVFEIHEETIIRRLDFRQNRVLDALEDNLVGGVFSWDGRGHDGSKADFTDAEITPTSTVYNNNKSYPAFSHCSINQDPGNGNKNSGDEFGAINGYLIGRMILRIRDCDYTINMFVKDMYVGGETGSQAYSSCTTDGHLSSPEKFHPAWVPPSNGKNFDVTNTKIQNGSIIYDGSLITIKNLKLNKTGNRIELSISDCNRAGEDAAFTQNEVYFYYKHYRLHSKVERIHSENATLTVVDLMGRTVSHEHIALAEGTNSFNISIPSKGIFLVSFKEVLSPIPKSCCSRKYRFIIFNLAGCCRGLSMPRQLMAFAIQLIKLIFKKQALS